MPVGKSDFLELVLREFSGAFLKLLREFSDSASESTAAGASQSRQILQSVLIVDLGAFIKIVASEPLEDVILGDHRFHCVELVDLITGEKQNSGEVSWHKSVANLTLKRAVGHNELELACRNIRSFLQRFLEIQRPSLTSDQSDNKRLLSLDLFLELSDLVNHSHLEVVVG